MKTGLIEQAWQALAKRLNLQPNSVQHTEMRKAFFAGAYTVMGILHNLGENEDGDEDAEVETLEGMYQECQAFRMSITGDPELN